MQLRLVKFVAAGVMFIFLALNQSHAQIRLDVFGGASPSATPSHAGILMNRESPHEEFIFNVAKVEPQFFFGAKAHMDLHSPFFLETGLLYSQRKSIYSVFYTMVDAEHPVSNHLLNHTMQLLMMPVNIGVSMGNVEVTSGIRAYHSFGTKTQLTQLANYQTENSFLQFGWQAGAGIFIGRTKIGIEYQSDFSRVGHGMSVNGHSLELPNVHGQFLATIQQSF
jgi:hypothetical protein